MRIPFEQNLKILAAEAMTHRRFVINTFLATVALLVVVGIFWPRTYVSSATIVVDDRSLMTPLLRDDTRQTGIMDRAKIAQQLIQSREAIHQAMINAGLLHGNVSAAEEARMMAGIRKHITVTNAGNNLIRIAYADKDPTRAYQVTQTLVQSFLAQTQGMSSRESRVAYDFINQQVGEYRGKIAADQAALTKLRANSLDASSAAQAAASREFTHLQSQHDQAQLELQEALGRRAELQTELAQQSDTDNRVARMDSLRKELSDDRAQLATLQLSYQDHYPGIVTLKERIAGIQKQIAHEGSAYPGRQTFIDRGAADRYFGELARNLAATNAQIAVLRAQVEESGTMIDRQQQAMNTSGPNAQVSRLMRDYAVDTATLSDLLKRREDAKLAMNMQRAQNDVSFQVADPANLPAASTGPAFSEFAIAGLLLGLALPLMLLYLRIQMDERVRFSAVISDKLNLPLVTSVPHLLTPAESESSRRGLQWLGVVVASVTFIVLSIIVSGSIT